MILVNHLNELFRSIISQNECIQAIVNLAALLGILTAILLGLFFLYHATFGFRLYVWSQLRGGTNLVKKHGKWAVITGATDGIGQSIAKELAKRGHSILVIGRNEEKLANTKRLLEAIENVGQVETVKSDLADSSFENYERIRSQVDPDNRDIGILINNAAHIPTTMKRFNRTPIDELINSINVNILAAVHLTRMIMPGMIQRQRGLILNNSSMFGNQTVPYLALYGQTKAFLHSFTEALQLEYSNHPLDIILLAPGTTYTKSFAATNTLKPSFMVLTADTYAPYVVNCLSTGIRKFAGHPIHAIQSAAIYFVSSLGGMLLLTGLLTTLYPTNVHLSPVMKRKKPSGKGENEEKRSLKPTV